MRTREFAFQRRTAQRSLALLARAGHAREFAVLRRELADQMALGIGDDDVVVEVHAQMLRAVHGGFERGTAIAGAAFLAAGVDDGLDLSVRGHDAQGVATPFQDVNVALAIGRHRARIGQGSLRRHRTVLGPAFLAVARDDAELAGGEVQLVNPREVGDEELLAGEVERDAVRPAAARLLGRDIVTRDAGHRARLHVHLAHPAGPGVTDQDVAIGQHGEVVRAIELRLQRRSAVSGRTGLARAGDMREHALGIHLQQAVARDHLDDEEIARAIKIHAERLLQPGLQGGDSVALRAPAGEEDNLLGVEGQREGEGG